MDVISAPVAIAGSLIAVAASFVGVRIRRSARSARKQARQRLIEIIATY